MLIEGLTFVPSRLASHSLEILNEIQEGVIRLSLLMQLAALHYLRKALQTSSLQDPVNCLLFHPYRSRTVEARLHPGSPGVG